MEVIIDKLLGMDSDTRRRTIEGVILYIFTAFATCNTISLSEQWQDIIVKILVLAVEAFVLFYEEHYKNNDHTEIAAEHTGEMRQEKLEQDPEYVGERFYTEDPNGVSIDDLDDAVDNDDDTDDEEEGVEIDE